MTFSGSAPALRELLPQLSITDAEIDTLLNYGPVAYLPGVALFLWHSQRQRPAAVHEALSGAGLLMVMGAAVRALVLIYPARSFLHVGQFLNGMAGPASMSAAPAFAALWFPPAERTLATAFVWTSQNSAPALGFVIALFVTSAGALRVVLLAEAASAMFAFLLWVLAAPKLPRTPPSATAAANAGSGQRPSGLAKELVGALCRRRFWFLALSGGFCVGGFQVWTSSLAVVLAGMTGRGAFGGFDVGIILSIAGNGFALLGILVAAPVAERFFHQRYKRLLLGVVALQVILSCVFDLALPTDGGGGTSPLGEGGLLAILCVSSVLNGFCAPVGLELGAEISYPCAEGYSSAIYTFATNLGGMLMLGIMALGGDALKGAPGCKLMTGFLAASWFMMLPVVEAYPRSTTDDTAAARVPEEAHAGLHEALCNEVDAAKS